MIQARLYQFNYRKVPRISSPPPLPTKKKGSCLNERIFVMVNASAYMYLFPHFRKEMVLQQDFKERHAAAFMITKIWFKRETIFFGGGGGGELIRGTLG